MKAMEIMKEELSKEGMHIAEEAIKAATVVIFDKIIPRLALEADEKSVKAIAAGAQLIAPALKEALLKAEDKIDGQVDA